MKIIDNLKSNRKKALANTSFLKKGKYVLLPNMRTYVHKDKYEEALNSFPKPRGKKGSRTIFYKLLRPLFSFKVKDTGDFMGETMYFSSTPNPADRDCKIFSYVHGKMVIVSGNKKRYDTYLKNRNNISELFPLPEFYEANEEKQYIIEEFILDKQANKNGSRELLDCVFEFYGDYYKKCKALNKFKRSDENEELLCQSVTKEESPVLYLHHADLSIDNIVYCQEPTQRLVFIDFDHENYYPPFYDVFFLITNQAFADNDSSMLSYFNEGRYDKYLIDYAKENNVTVKDILSSCIKSLWYKRLQGYSQEKKKDFEMIFKDLVNRANGRINNGKCN